MSDPHLILGNKNYSSWSMRPFVLMRQLGIPFTSETIWLDTDTARDQKLARSPAGRVPILTHSNLTIWDSLAIAEYLAETFPDAGVWPADRRTRARARSLCAEMHAGFADLRAELPMNCRARKERRERSAATTRDIARIQQIFTDTRREWGAGGPFLLGAFCAADAFFAPVVSRFVTYDVPVEDRTAAAYQDTMLALPALQEWFAAAEGETRSLPHTDAIG